MTTVIDGSVLSLRVPPLKQAVGRGGFHVRS